MKTGLLIVAVGMAVGSSAGYFIVSRPCQYERRNGDVAASAWDAATSRYSSSVTASDAHEAERAWTDVERAAEALNRARVEMAQCREREAM